MRARCFHTGPCLAPAASAARANYYCIAKHTDGCESANIAGISAIIHAAEFANERWNLANIARRSRSVNSRAGIPAACSRATTAWLDYSRRAGVVQRDESGPRSRRNGRPRRRARHERAARATHAELYRVRELFAARGRGAAAVNRRAADAGLHARSIARSGRHVADDHRVIGSGRFRCYSTFKVKVKRKIMRLKPRNRGGLRGMGDAFTDSTPIPDSTGLTVEQMLAEQNAGMDTTPYATPTPGAGVPDPASTSTTNWGSVFSALGQALAPVAQGVVQYKLATAQAAAAANRPQQTSIVGGSPRLYTTPTTGIFGASTAGGSSMMPFLMIGGVALVAFLLLRK